MPFGYDANGNMLSDGNLGYHYDDANQLIRVRATNWMSEFVCDGKVRRGISCKYEKPGPTTTAVTSVTTFNGTGWDGMRFTVGSTPIVVTGLGRWKLSGHSGRHTLKLVDAGHVDVPGASVTVRLASGSSGQFIYTTLGSRSSSQPTPIGGLLARTGHTVAKGRTDLYHQDGSGNVAYLANQRQGLAAKCTCDAYGRVLARSGTS